MNNTSKMMVYAAAGAVAGGILAILFAPAKGSDTRDKLAKRGKAMAEDMKTASKEAGERIQNMANDTREFVKEKKSVFNPAIL